MASGDGKLELKFTPVNGEPMTMEVYEFKDGGGVGMAMYNTDQVKLYEIFMEFLLLAFGKVPCELYGAKCAIHIAKSSNWSQNVY